MTQAPRTVVVADDDVEVAQSLARVVRSLGHLALVAHDGLEALSLLRNNRVDLLLSDIDMPGMDGVALVSHARLYMLAPMRILLTANARLETALHAINSGEIHRYITKPWDTRELVRILEDAFARIEDFTRMQAADMAVRRMRAAREALEAEYPGLTHVERKDDAYVVDARRAEHVLAQLEDSVLHALVTTRSRSR